MGAAYALKERGAKNIYLVATFALFTEGIDAFVEAYDNRMFDKIYTTNASYILKFYIYPLFLKILVIKNREKNTLIIAFKKFLLFNYIKL